MLGIFGEEASARQPFGKVVCDKIGGKCINCHVFIGMADKLVWRRWIVPVFEIIPSRLHVGALKVVPKVISLTRSLRRTLLIETAY